MPIFLICPASPDFNYYVPFINTTDIRRAIHVGSISYGSQSEDVEMALGNESAIKH